MKMKYVVLLCTLTFLTACGGSTVRDTMGLTHQAPDEFRVVSRPPLSVPPEFNLRPPAAPGEVSTGVAQPAAKQAQALVAGAGAPSALTPGSPETAVQPVAAAEIGKDDVQSLGPDPSELQFLQDAGGAAADGTIRQKLQQDAAAYAPENQSMLDSLRKPADSQPVVDAVGESARLKGDKVANQPPTAGTTPMSQAPDNGTLGRIFGY